jgi:polar amino acid transport system ATP-binding protein
MAEFSKVLDVAGVSKRFGDVAVLSDVSFQVDKGETVCVLGPSGSGKSTLLRCINWLERPDAGQIYLNGERVGINGAGIIMSDRDLSQIRTRIGMVFQHFALWPHLTVLQNLMEAPVQVQRRPKAEVRDEALALLAKVGLSEKRDAFPARLSGGQKQRVGIARALAMEPKVLLLDEPFGALDALTRAHLQDSVMALHQKLGNTILMITHDVDEAVLLSDRIVMMTNGPSARIGEVLEVPLARPRKRLELATNPGYLKCRQRVLEFLYERHRFVEAA